MSYIAGVDIGNSTTEVCVGESASDGTIHFLTSASCPTTGTKGTVANTHAIKAALKQAMGRIGREISDISLIRLNEAAPVIGGDFDRDYHNGFLHDRAQSFHSCRSRTGSRGDSPD